MKNIKVALVGAGSVQFAVGVLHDLVLSEKLTKEAHLTVHLMDIVPENMAHTYDYAVKLNEHFNYPMELKQTLILEEALEDADFVITAIEVERYEFWSQDFHIPRNYGSSQIYGENGGPGSMFHTLRNLGPMLHIAHKMEEICPQAWLINFTNPEAKLVEAISKLTKIHAVGLCHGLDMGITQISEFLERDKSTFEIEAGGLNHFGMFTKITDKATGEDLYPAFKAAEARADRLADWDHIGLSRTMLHIYGLYAYPGTNHCGEYLSWANDFYAGESLLYRYEPVQEKLWQKDSRVAEFVYAADGTHLDGKLFEKRMSQLEWMKQEFTFDPEKVRQSGEWAIPIIEAIFFDVKTYCTSVNFPNHGAIQGLPDDMVVETQAWIDGSGISLRPMSEKLPTAMLAMINIQGAIHQLIIEAYTEQSKTKLLQAILLDPNAPTYYQACALIDEMCERQNKYFEHLGGSILPKLEWK